MNKPSRYKESPVFGIPAKELDSLGIGSVASILATGTDIAIVAEKDGTVREVTFDNEDLNDYGLKFWPGKNLTDLVTAESVQKIERLLTLAATPGLHGEFQVNHASANLPDLPVKYRVIHENHWDHLLILGEDLRQLMQMQQRLVQTQLDLETDYRSLQQNAARYRTVFQMLPEPLALIDGEKKTIIDVNTAFALEFNEPNTKLVGKPVKNLFKRGTSDAAIDAISEARHSGVAITLDQVVAGSGRTVTLAMTPYREKGTANILMSLPPLKDDDTQTPAPEVSGASLLDKLPEPVISISNKGEVLGANDRFLDLIKLTNTTLMVGRNANSWIGASPVDLQVLLSKLKEEDVIRGFKTVIRDQLGGETAASLSASADRQSGEIHILISSTSPSDNQVAMRKLSRSEEADGFSELVGRVPMKDLVRESLDVIEKMCIETALDQTRNNRASAADLLGLSRQSLYIKLRKHGLENYKPKK